MPTFLNRYWETTIHLRHRHSTLYIFLKINTNTLYLVIHYQLIIGIYNFFLRKICNRCLWFTSFDKRQPFFLKVIIVSIRCYLNFQHFCVRLYSVQGNHPPCIITMSGIYRNVCHPSLLSLMSNYLLSYLREEQLTYGFTKCWRYYCKVQML